MKKILFLTTQDPNNRTSWSGVPYSINQELKKKFEIEYLTVSVKASLFTKIINRIYKVLFKKSNLYNNNIQRAKKAANIINPFLSQKNDYQAIFVIDSGCIAFIETKIPIVYYSDAVASCMIDYYWTDVSTKAKKEANYVQKRALDNCSICILTSNWARKAAINDYGMDPKKVFIVHTGANIEKDDYTIIEHEEINLLFCGVDWIRKGGDVAVDCLRYLTENDPNRKYVLHMYGCNPPKEIKDDNIIQYGFLNRDIPEQLNIFESLWRKADFFIAPLRADCAAASFCEACAFSVPSITFDTGGIGDHIINDYNGYRLPPNSKGSDFAKVIISWLNSPGKLAEMKMNARHLYENDLNWQVAGIKISELLGKCIIDES